jgi:hypothetical protein
MSTEQAKKVRSWFANRRGMKRSTRFTRNIVSLEVFVRAAARRTRKKSAAKSIAGKTEVMASPTDRLLRTIDRRVT